MSIELYLTIMIIGYIIGAVISGTTWKHFDSSFSDEPEIFGSATVLWPLVFPLWIMYKLWSWFLNKAF